MTDEKTSNQNWKPKINPWIIAATVALAAFMEVLDTSIANVAYRILPATWPSAIPTREPGYSPVI